MIELGPGAVALVLIVTWFPGFLLILHLLGTIVSVQMHEIMNLLFITQLFSWFVMQPAIDYWSK